MLRRPFSLSTIVHLSALLKSCQRPFNLSNLMGRAGRQTGRAWLGFAGLGPRQVWQLGRWGRPGLGLAGSLAGGAVRGGSAGRAGQVGMALLGWVLGRWGRLAGKSDLMSLIIPNSPKKPKIVLSKLLGGQVGPR
ncbi:hypothetical protein PPACK8108_LOCUS10997 [Phakopsora pachyrhizi]|uniref:Uncharacterized protein n=1 Tax=Phakopsora pachyrhizi TaxID=170000 RepID=A0AAV0AZ89_PHAPC|nr:hypothetical protein PPACK8108_LOCUS10997 [Phakopsora pachyrhizi]